MANENSKIKITHQQLDNVSKLLDTLKDEATQAHKDGDAFMLSVYSDLLRVASPIVVRAYARLERQDKAEINSKHKALRKSLRSSSTSEQSSEPEE